MRICVLASGSKGNSTYIETENSKILIDAGISKKDLEQRLSLLDVNPSEIDAILLTHEHSDHIKGVANFAKTYNTKVYANQKSWPIISQKLEGVPIKNQIEFNGKDFNIKDLSIQTFDLEHDSLSCVGFSIIENNKIFTIATDLGRTTPEIIKRFQNSDFAVLESNHDIKTLLDNPNYSYHLKNRILSNHGHLNNVEAADTIIKLLGTKTRGLILAHLSEQNNSPEIVKNTIAQKLEQNKVNPNDVMHIELANQHTPTKIYKLKD